VSILDVLKDAPRNLTIEDALTKCYSVLKDHERVVASVSGGSDSDVIMDLIIRCGGKGKTRFVFFNTGLEYEATKEQLNFLRDKYDVEIEVIPPIKPIPLCVRQYGAPFWSKHVSEMMMRLQRHNFKWEDEPFDVLLQRYPGCKVALQWWCNEHREKSPYNISRVRLMKEFVVANPPTFKSSNKCCHYAKKEPAKRFVETADCDLNCNGMRKAEGGSRMFRISSCYTSSLGGADQYRPIFWFSDADKAEYEAHYGVTHSDCYKVWGMKRTGCAGCPFGRNYEQELELAKQYEPKFYAAMLKVFGESYEYRRQFEAFREEQKKEEGCRESRN
jgi:3'-phosphoadenosine 5'-phosphosulfate sulfotransferase (PAPS reductase)/FAD synthetase